MSFSLFKNPIIEILPNTDTISFMWKIPIFPIDCTNFPSL